MVITVGDRRYTLQTPSVGGKVVEWVAEEDALARSDEGVFQRGAFHGWRRRLKLKWSVSLTCGLEVWVTGENAGWVAQSTPVPTSFMVIDALLHETVIIDNDWTASILDEATKLTGTVAQLVNKDLELVLEETTVRQAIVS